MFKEINDKNWLLYAQHIYDNPTLDSEAEFYDDIKRFKYIKRLFKRYNTIGELKIRLVLNHIIVLCNVFGVEGGITLMLYKTDREHWPVLKSVFNYLGYLYPHELNNIKEDDFVVKLLENL